jgi:EAL domain-containing protein (putative c-di-GMP-specific phosphodiesterase class I)
MDERNLSVIRNVLPKVLKEVEKELSQDPLVRESLRERSSLEKLMQLQNTLAKLFVRSLSGKKSLNGSVDKAIKENRVPYAAVFKAVAKVKERLLKSLTNSEMDRVELLAASKRLEELLNAVARAYLRSEGAELLHLIDSPFKEKLLFKRHADWVREVALSLKELDFDRFPLVKHDQCGFSQVLRYPESLMVCMDKNLCSYLYQLHSLIHKLADSLFYYGVRGEFNEAYLIFKDLKEQFIRFGQVLGELYFVAYSDLERSFFKLLSFLSKERSCTVLSVDLKGIRLLNALYGEEAVNKAIEAVKRRIEERLNPEEELLIKGVTSDFYLLTTGNGTELAKKVERAIEEWKESGIKLKGAVIVGLQLPKELPLTQEELLKALNKLRREAKGKGVKLTIKVGDEAREVIGEILKEEFNEKFLIQKLKKEEVEVVFQPIFNDEGEVAALEVLGRLKNDGELIPAGVFIDKIHALKLCSRFDSLILKRLRQKKKLLNQFNGLLFINVSFPSLLNGSYVEELKRTLQELGKNRVLLEITEQHIVKSSQVVEQVSSANGVLFVIDDFGSGYSSLRTLLELIKKGVLRFLKVDGSLIKGIEKDPYIRKVVKVVAHLGKELEVGVVGEFVESYETEQVLKALGVELLQGYYLSPPLTAEELLIKAVQESWKGIGQA